jgi:hypothetical protein
MLPKFGANLGRNGLSGRGYGFGAALGAHFGPPMSLWTKKDKWGGFGASVGDTLTCPYHQFTGMFLFPIFEK